MSFFLRTFAAAKVNRNRNKIILTFIKHFSDEARSHNGIDAADGGYNVGTDVLEWYE